MITESLIMITEKLNPIVIALFIRRRKLNISLDEK